MTNMFISIIIIMTHIRLVQAGPRRGGRLSFRFFLQGQGSGSAVSGTGFFKVSLGVRGFRSLGSALQRSARLRAVGILGALGLKGWHSFLDFRV